MSTYILKRNKNEFEILAVINNSEANPRSNYTMNKLAAYARQYGMEQLLLVEEIPVKYDIHLSPIENNND